MPKEDLISHASWCSASVRSMQLPKIEFQRPAGHVVSTGASLRVGDKSVAKIVLSKEVIKALESKAVKAKTVK